MKQTNIKRGDVFWGNFDPAKHTETQKTRPALIVSDDLLNGYSLRVMVAPITSQVKKIYWWDYPILLGEKECKIMIDQMRVFDKERLGSFLQKISDRDMKEIDVIIKRVLGII